MREEEERSRGEEGRAGQGRIGQDRIVQNSTAFYVYTKKQNNKQRHKNNSIVTIPDIEQAHETFGGVKLVNWDTTNKRSKEENKSCHR